MCMLRLSHLLVIVPIALLSTLSFFVLLAVRKVEEKALKVFGYLIISLLGLAILVIFSSAVYSIARSSVLMERIYQRNMKMEHMGKMMQRGNMPGMTMFEKGALPRNEKRQGMSKSGENKGIVFKAE